MRACPPGQAALSGSRDLLPRERRKIIRPAGRPLLGIDPGEKNGPGSHRCRHRPDEEEVQSRRLATKEPHHVTPSHNQIARKAELVSPQGGSPGGPGSPERRHPGGSPWTRWPYPSSSTSCPNPSTTVSSTNPPARPESPCRTGRRRESPSIKSGPSRPRKTSAWGSRTPAVTPSTPPCTA